VFRQNQYLFVFHKPEQVQQDINSIVLQISIPLFYLPIVSHIELLKESEIIKNYNS
jgi:hypothetical protein